MEAAEVLVSRFTSSAFKCAVAETQGGRDYHEDAYAVHCNARRADFWVLDGHRGDTAARFGARTLPKELKRRANATDGGAILRDNSGLLADECIERGFQAVDQQLRTILACQQKLLEAPLKPPGSTVAGAIASLQANGTYTVKLVNCGDSRGVLIRGPAEHRTSASPAKVRLPRLLESVRSIQSQKECWDPQASWLPEWPAIVETIDHKPNSLPERARIEAAGGHVSGGRIARVDGHLAVSRGLGDFDFKGDRGLSPAQQKVSCIPDIYEASNLQPGSLVLLACDGLWDVVSTDEAAHFVRSRLKKEPSADMGDIASGLVRSALSKTEDNVTVLLAQCVNPEA